MKHAFTLTCLLVGIAAGSRIAFPAGRTMAEGPGMVVLHSPEATANERLAAREVRRYVYLRTGQLLPIQASATARPALGAAIVVARKDNPLAMQLATDRSLTLSLESLQPGQFWLRTFKSGGQSVLLLTGGDDVGTLYAAYRFAESLGVRFYLHGDVLPDRKVPLELDFLDERHQPLFNLRGIQPFHDFPEGPDWWNLDDYAGVIAQLPKLRMNFFGLHTYPEGAPNAEPTVWIGLGRDADAQGRVSYSYPASYMNTLRGNWGYQAKRTSAFLFGGDQVFERDAFSADVLVGYCPQPESGEDCNTVFNQTGEMLRQAFTLARRLGVQTCVGTETPLTIPLQVQNRLRSLGKDPSDPAVRRELYAGLFQRAAAAYPLDYYWFWTPEGWTWEGTKDEQVQRTLDDIRSAIAAAQEVKAPFRLATCGWVLGPQQDRALFDKALPKDMPVSCINREVGRTPVDRGFAEVSGRGKWAIPWMEDDPALTVPQLWVGRMRRDAADARRYGCDGLMGIHWRTRILGPNVAALAQAAWNQDGWNKDPLAPPKPLPRTAGPTGGSAAAFPTNAIVDTEDAVLYRTVRYNVSAYNLPLPNGAYTVTLKFCEPHYREAGKRVFGVKLQGRPVLDKLDIFARVGANRALDCRFEGVAVADGWLAIDFVPIVEFPSIAALVVEGPAASKRINCGGPAYKDFEADAPPAPSPADTFAPVTDFYLDWARHEFGEAAGPSAAALLAKVDCRLPRPADWVDGPGGIRPDPRPWDQVRREYEFVAEFESLAGKVAGAGERARYEYWVESFRYLRAMAELNCVWAAYQQAVSRAKAAELPELKKLIVEEQALPLRRQMVRLLRAVYGHLLATVSNPGEMGTVANWDQHLLPGLLTKPAEELAQLLGAPLPEDALPDRVYRGPSRVFLPTTRSSIVQGEPLRVKAVVLGAGPPREGWLRWRKLGQGGFQPVPLRHLDRGVFLAEMPARALEADFEYYVEVVDAAGRTLRAPATAPALNQTVVVMAAR